MLVWDAAFASTFASKLQVTGRSKQSCPHFQENLCRNTLYKPRREGDKQGAWCYLAGLPPVPHRGPAAAQAPDPASLPTAFPPKSPLPPCIPHLLPYCRPLLLSQVFSLLTWSSIPTAPLHLLSTHGLRNRSWDRMLSLLHHTPGKNHFCVMEKGHT